LPNNSGSLAIFAAIRRASCLDRSAAILFSLSPHGEVKAQRLVFLKVANAIGVVVGIPFETIRQSEEESQHRWWQQ
jgi:hypothetical protein